MNNNKLHEIKVIIIIIIRVEITLLHFVNRFSIPIIIKINDKK